MYPHNIRGRYKYPYRIKQGHDFAWGQSPNGVLLLKRHSDHATLPFLDALELSKLLIKELDREMLSVDTLGLKET